MFAATWLGTGAASSAAHPYSLMLDGLDIARKPGSPGGLFGTDMDTVVIEERLGEPSVMHFTIDDPASVLAIRKNADVYAADHRGRYADDGATIITDDLFRGFLVSFTADPDITIGRRWHAVALSLDALMDRRVLTSGVLPTTLTVTQALQQLFSTLDPRISSLADEQSALSVDYHLSPGSGNLIFPATGSAFPLLHAVPLAGKTYRQAAADIVAAGLVGYTTDGAADEIVDIDIQGRVRWNVDPGVAQAAQLPFDTIYEGLTAATTAPYKTRPAPAEIGVDTDTSELVTAVYIRGVDAASSLWVENAASISTYGRIERFIEAPEATSLSAARSVGLTYLAEHRIVLRLGFALAGTHDQLALPTGWDAFHGAWHTRQYAQLNSDSGLWSLPSVGMLHSLTRTFSGGGAHTRLELSFVAPQSSPASAIAAKNAVIQDQSKAAQRIVGTLNEVALRSKAGIPTDADFDVPRDGFVVVDTTDNEMWVRTSGNWVRMSQAITTGSTAGFNIVNGGAATYANKLLKWTQIGSFVYWSCTFDVTLAGSGAGTVTIDTTTAPGPSLSAHRVDGARSASIVDWLWRVTNSGGMVGALYIGNVAAVGADLTVGTYGFAGVYSV